MIYIIILLMLIVPVSASLFSATFKRKIERLCRDILIDPIRIIQGDIGVVWYVLNNLHLFLLILVYELNNELISTFRLIKMFHNLQESSLPMNQNGCG